MLNPTQDTPQDLIGGFSQFKGADYESGACKIQQRVESGQNLL
jgi:hypothetical protein